MLNSSYEGRNKIFSANSENPLFSDIRNIVLKSSGIDKVVSDILKKLGPIKVAFLRGDYAVGKDSGLIDLVIVGDNMNMKELDRVRLKTESLITRKIAVLVLSPEEYQKLEGNFSRDPILILLENDNTSM